MGIIRLKDIAIESGFTISTVSRVLNGDTTRKHNPKTVKKIVEVADRLGYFESRSKMLSRMKNPFRIASIFVSDHENASPFFSEIIKGVKEQADITKAQTKVNYRLLMRNQSDYTDLVSSKNFDAAIILGRASKQVIEFIEEHIPIRVYAGLNSIGTSDEVLCNARQGIKEAVKILHEKGARQIGYIGTLNTKGDIFNEHRYFGFLEGITELGLEFTDKLAADVNLTAADGYSGAKQLFAHARPKGIVCANDITAVGVMKYLNETQIRVPDDVMVIGFDNIESSNYLTPSLSTFDVPKKDMGRFAFSLAYERYVNPRSFNVSVNIPYTFIDRQSTACEWNPHNLARW